jgi:hypothetical protein
VIVSGLPRPGCDSANEEQVGEKRTAPARSLRRGRVWARVRRPLLALAQVPLVVVVAVGAGGCRHAETATPTGASSAGRIVVDRSIGPVSIGIARQRVVRLLGPPDTSIAVRSTTREPGTLARYGSHGADLSIVYDSRGRVASIETYSPRYRTSTGVGPGAPLARGSRLPGFRRNSCDLGYWNAGGRTGRRAVVTVFTPNGGLVDSVLITQLRFDTNCAQAGRGLEPRPNVVLDRSIGGVSLGMIERTVVKRLGDPVTTRRARVGPGAVGRLARYVVAGAPFLVTYDSARHVVSLRAFSRFFFTPAGIGPGSPRSFVAALRRFARDPCKIGFWNGTARGSPARPVTVFPLRNGVVASVLITERRLFTRCRP